MNSDEIAVLFRAGELARRKARLKIIANYETLGKEELSPEERAIDAKAIQRIKQQALDLDRSLCPSYWQRLWAALRGL